MNNLYNRIEVLCERAGITITAMCRESGASRGSLSDLKMGRVTSLNTVTLSKIAAYFGISVDYLIGNDQQTKKAPTVSGERDEADKVISFLSSLPPDRLRGILLALGAPEDVLAEVDRTEQER